ncbi:hypothetical protein M9M90_03640 [Phenylobacterium sp. LH3H17]|uniref:hypothetical protein n=1 Tax=Phenylobacterium sp. LH3H17 TaxID=2903901 RepID=UPI0020C9874B|nr:hypothetical protein [Phenylobacterium sp. LH3H17]UTP40279.1 hypothetical protein M9M90_03640 [Phenylobacterium sp. LH3H17]
MKPDVPAVLAETAALMVRNAAPDVPPAERAGALGLSAALLGFAAQAWDGAAHNLVQENRAIRTLLGEAGSDEDLHLSVLSAENDRLRATLIALHTEVEGKDPAREAAIWAELVASTERRLVAGSPV